MRIYVPATLDELDAVAHSTRAARWTVTPRDAHAVTGDLATALPDEDEESLEYTAALGAADDSLALIAGRADAPLQRTVVTVEVPDDAVGAPSGEPDDAVASAVTVTSTVEGVAIVCVHVDEADAATDIADVLAAADDEPHDAGARHEAAAGPDAHAGATTDSPTALDEALQRVTDRDLLWYDWSEIQTIPRADSARAR